MKIAVIGYSCTGKTTLTKELAAKYPDHKIYHCDDVRAEDFNLIYGIVYEQILADGKKDFIVEGTQVASILRKGAENRNLFVDVVINCVSEEGIRMQRYEQQRTPEQAYRQPAVTKGLDTVIADYKNTCAALGISIPIIEYRT